MSKLAESLADHINEPSEVSSSEEMLFKICDLNKTINSIPNSNDIVCVAFDVKALYPSLNARETGKVVNQELQKSNIEFRDIDYLETARYLAASCSVWELQRMGIRKLVPTRTKSTGCRTGIKGKQMIDGKQDNFEKFNSWTFHKKQFTSKEKKLLLGASLETGIKASFNLHCYEFGGKIFKQRKGGPTGKKLT